MGQEASIGVFEPGASARFTRLSERPLSHEGQLDYVRSPDIAPDGATPLTDGDSFSHDRVYYGSAGRFALQRWLSRISRQRILGDFVRELNPTPETRILDIGASGVETREANMLEKFYPWPHNITAAIVGDTSKFLRAHPEGNAVQIVPGGRLPFPDKSFDIAYSSAVLEHVGGRAQRRAFIAEAARVARAVFIVLPNGWFPVEHHTGVPFFHYLPSLFRRLLAGTGLDYWSHEQNLDFITPGMLAREWPSATSPTIRYAGLPFGVLSSNLIAVAED
jgi:hypothetical protein